jgi:hypothetical protein
MVARRTRLLARVAVPGSERLVTVDSGSGATVTLAKSGTEGWLGSASWSSDGSTIAYARRCWENRIGDTFCDLALMNDDGSSKRLLYPWGPDVTGPSSDPPVWIPRTKQLLVPIWGNDGHTRLVDAVGGQSKLISRTPWTSLAVSSDGSTIGRIARSIGQPDVVALARPDGSVTARFPLRKEPTRNLSWGSAASDHQLWLP